MEIATMTDQREVTLWPSRDDYPRFRELCDDKISDTFDEFESLAGKRLAELAKQGINIEKLAFDPDRMSQWCRSHFGKVDASTRRLYANFIALSD
jgi:hypothetical protein